MMLYLATLFAFIVVMLALGLGVLLCGRSLQVGCAGLGCSSPSCCSNKGKTDDRFAARS